MASLVEDEYNIGPCPCRKGSIVRHEADMDHGYRALTYWDRIECPTCAEEWRVEGNYLVNIASEEPHNRLNSEHSAAWKAVLHPLQDRIVNGYFANGDFRSKAAEHHELQRLQMFSESVEKYRELRRTRSPAPAAQSANDRAWLLSQCGTEEERAELEQAFWCQVELSGMVDAAKREIVRRPIRTT